MFNNGMNGFGNRNIAGVPKGPGNLGGIPQKPANISGINKMPTKSNPFANVKIDRQMSKQIMNSSGENLIRNELNKGGNFHGNN